MNLWRLEGVTFHGYIHASFEVLVMCFGGKSVFEQYSGRDKLSENEINALLAANSAAYIWERTNSTPISLNGPGEGWPAWRAVDRSQKTPMRFAVLNGYTLSFYTRDVVPYCVRAAQTAVDTAGRERREAVKGF